MAGTVPEGGDLLAVEMIDAAAIVDELAARGATSRPLLNETGRQRLLALARAMPYRPGRAVIGSGEAVVRQELEWSDGFVDGDPFGVLARRYQALWDLALTDLPSAPFAPPLVFNEMMMTRYEPGWLGITPHRDHATYVNLVALIVLGGEGRFCVADDRSGANARAVDGSPGRVILMRAPGFLGSDARPFHFVSDIRASRIVFGLRQEDPPGARLERARSSRPADTRPTDTQPANTQAGPASR
ncbi:MAG: hypothetical protein ACREER_10685 [Alphaproteobacteria bacterium]